jgi:alkylation response protein AidB-like acyl-CoA dehydrogenase
VLETTALAVPLLAAAAVSTGATKDAAAERSAGWLAQVAAGRAVATVGPQDMRAVPGAMGADLLVVERGGEVHAVAASEATMTARPSLDGSRRAAEVSWAPSSATRVASGPEAAALMASVRDRAAMATGAVLLGVADRLLTITAGYARERFQFGHAIGSFQAVKHHLANALIRLEFARPAVYRAAWSLDRGQADAGVHASMAKALAAEAATGAARVALQVHGAIGYTWECDIQLWMKPAWALAAAWGDAGFHRARVLERLLAAGV